VFNRVWTSPETLPTMDEIASPQAWLERVGSRAPGELPRGEANGSETNGSGGTSGSDANGSGGAAG
jgi:Zincin-like metallopeptidase